MIGVFVGFVGKPTPMSGVSEDLSTVLEEDMMILEKFSEKLQNDAGEIEGASRLDTEDSTKCSYAVIDACCDFCCDAQWMKMYCR